jgi:hypothetical protein
MEAPTLPHNHQHHTPHHQTKTSPTDTEPQSPTQSLTVHIRHIIDTAPRPTPAQLERLASLLRQTNNKPH